MSNSLKEHLHIQHNDGTSWNVCYACIGVLHLSRAGLSSHYLQGIQSWICDILYEYELFPTWRNVATKYCAFFSERHSINIIIYTKQIKDI